MGRSRAEGACAVERILMNSKKELSVAEIHMEFKKMGSRLAQMEKKKVQVLCHFMAKSNRISRSCRQSKFGKVYVYTSNTTTLQHKRKEPLPKPCPRQYENTFLLQSAWTKVTHA